MLAVGLTQNTPHGEHLSSEGLVPHPDDGVLRAEGSAEGGHRVIGGHSSIALRLGEREDIALNARLQRLQALMGVENHLSRVGLGHPVLEDAQIREHLDLELVRADDAVAREDGELVEGDTGAEQRLETMLDAAVDTTEDGRTVERLQLRDHRLSDAKLTEKSLEVVERTHVAGNVPALGSLGTEPALRHLDDLAEACHLEMLVPELVERENFR